MSSRFIPVVSDGEIARNLALLKSTFPSLGASIQIENTHFDVDSLNSEPLKGIAKANGFNINYLNVSYGQFNVTYNATHNQPTSLVKWDVTQNSSSGASEDQLSFLSMISRKFAVPPVSSIEGNSTEALAGFKSIENALAGAVHSFAELQTSYLAKNEELKAQHSQNIEQLRKDYEGAAKKRELELDERDQQLTKLRKELDDRSNTHARRDIRKDIKSSITDSLKDDSFASIAEGKRWFVRFAFWTSIALILFFATFSAYSLNLAIEKKEDTIVWLLGAKSAIGGISLLGFLLLYLRWEMAWLSLRANYESNLAATKIDIDRASWVAESLLEWNRESPDKPVPEELLVSFTRRLFDWDAKTEDHQTANDSLASVILGSAAKVQIGPSGANLEIDRKGLRALKKE